MKDDKQEPASGASGEECLRWLPITILVSGPDKENADRPLLGGADAGLSPTGFIHEDGRLYISISGMCLLEPSMPELPPRDRPAVVLTSALPFAPFMLRRHMPKKEEREKRPHSSVSVALEPTTEVFVLQSDDPSSQAAEAEFMACVAMEEVEDIFKDMQAGLACNRASMADSGSATAESKSDGPVAEWRTPHYGSLSFAVLHVSQRRWKLSERSRTFELRAEWLKGPLSTMAVGDQIDVHASLFGIFKPSLFTGLRLPGRLASISPRRDVLLVDASCAPGCEGGVVATRPAAGWSNAATAVAEDRPVPLALLLPHLHVPERELQPPAVAVAASFNTICRSLHSLPKVALMGLFGKSARLLIHRVAASPSSSSSTHSCDSSMALRAAAASSISGALRLGSGAAVHHRDGRECLCELSTIESGNSNATSAIAIVVSGAKDGHVVLLVASKFLRAATPKHSKTAVCNCRGVLQSQRCEGGAGDAITLLMQELHSFIAMLPGLSLVVAREGYPERGPSSRLSAMFRPVPWCVPPGTLRDLEKQHFVETQSGGDADVIQQKQSLMLELDEAYKEGTEVAWYSLQCKEDQHPAPPLSRSDPRGERGPALPPRLGVLSRSASSPIGPWMPALIEARFPSPVSLGILVLRSPEPLALGLTQPILPSASLSARSSPLPAVSWSLTALGLAPLLLPLWATSRELSSQGEQVQSSPLPRVSPSSFAGLAQHAQTVDKQWQTLIAQGHQAMLWQLETGTISITAPEPHSIEQQRWTAGGPPQSKL